MRTDQVRIADPAVVDALARLHAGLQLLDHVAFLDQVVLDGDAGDLGEGLGERLALVFVRRDGLGNDRDLVHASPPSDRRPRDDRQWSPAGVSPAFGSQD